MSKKAKNPIPEGMTSVTPVMCFNGNCRQAIEVYKKAFKATEMGIYDAPDGKSVWHAMRSRLRLLRPSAILISKWTA